MGWEDQTRLPIQLQKGGVGLWEKATLQTFMIDPHNGSGGRGDWMLGKVSETPTPRLEDRIAGPTTRMCTHTDTQTHTHTCTPLS